MWYQYFHNLVIYMHAHPNLGGMIAFLIAFTESLAIIGAIFPGSITLTAMGVLIGSGALPMLSTILWSIAGALTGDTISYGIGLYYDDRLRKFWPFTRYPNLLKAGENFFQKHGGKSIIIGRFAGPARSIVPVVAGLMHMHVFRFIFSALIASMLWALCYIVPGIIVGALSLELPPATATKFIVVILILIMLSWLIFWFVHFFFKTIANGIDFLVLKFWKFLKNHRRLHWVTTLLNDPRYPEHHQQLTIALFTLITGALFLALFAGVIMHAAFFHVNEPLHEILRSLRNRVCDDIMIVFTILGDKFTLLTASILLLAWFALRRYWWAAIHWFAIIFLTVGAGEFFKQIYFNARPTGLLVTPAGSSFPSGHTTLSLALFGFLATLIARELPVEKRKIPYVVITVLVFIIGLSRIYLGAHWLTDVIGAVLLGLTCMLLVTLSYRRKPTPHIPPKSLSLVAIIFFLISWVGFSFATFHKNENNYSLYWPSLSINSQRWWKQQPEARQIPLYVISRIGKPRDALNIQWLGNLDEITKTLNSQGWQKHPTRIRINNSFHENIATTKNKTNKTSHHLPLFPTLYHNQAPVLLMTKTIQNHQVTFQLWKSNIHMEDTNQQLWLGNINSYLTPNQKLKDLNNSESLIFNDITRIFTRFLKPYSWKIITISSEQQPTNMDFLHWNGKLLLIRPH